MANSILCMNGFVEGGQRSRESPLAWQIFVCSQCRKVIERTVEPIGKLCVEVETVNGLSFGKQIEC